MSYIKATHDEYRPDRCKFDHPQSNRAPPSNRPPPVNRPPQSQQSFGTPNPFTALQNPPPFGQSRPPAHGRGNQTHAPNGGRGDRSRQNDNKYPWLPDKWHHGFNAQTISDDLSSRERPMWPFSSYAPVQWAPRNLFEGEAEQSPEEMRLMYYLAQAQGNPQPAIDRENQFHQASQQRISQAVQDPHAADRYLKSGQKMPNNRWDSVNRMLEGGPPLERELEPSPPQPQQSQSVGTSFSQPAQPGSGFNQPSNQPSNVPPFGQPSQPNGFGNQSSTPFGQPSQLGAKPNPFEQAAGGTHPFGNPTQPAQPSSFGGVSQNPSPFGQQAQPQSQSVPFGQPSLAPQNPSPFAQPAPQNQGQFTQPQQQNQNPFGQPAQSQVANPFGQPAESKPDPFAQSAQPNPSPFVQPAPSNPNPFSQPPQQSQQNANPFGQSGQRNPNPFGQANGISASGSAGASQRPPYARPHLNLPPCSRPDPQSEATLPPRPRQPITSYAGKPVEWINNSAYVRDPAGGYLRVFNAEGPNESRERAKRNGAEEEQAAYQQLGDKLTELEATYQKAMQTGSFEGPVPEVPPMVDWIGYDV